MPVLPDGTHLPYPGDPGYDQMPPQVQALIQQLMAAQGGSSGGQMPQAPQGGDSGQSGDWLADALNAVHHGMVEEGDPKQVSLLGAILNQLTTFQANRANSAQQSG